jgi:hypothetical protein
LPFSFKSLVDENYNPKPVAGKAGVDRAAALKRELTTEAPRHRGKKTKIRNLCAPSFLFLFNLFHLFLNLSDFVAPSCFFPVSPW